MANEDLSVRLGLDASGLVTGGKKAEQSLVALSESATSTARSFTLLSPSMQRLTFGVNGVAPAAAKSGTAVKRMGVDLMGTSRVMQDFAFGPAAIANNLEGLARDFQRVGSIAKETGQTFTQTLVASLTGAGGVNLAIGAATFAMSLATFGMQAWTRMFDQGGKKAKSVSTDVKFLTDAVGAYNQAVTSGLKSGQDELAHLTRLQLVVQNNTLSTNARKEAYKELVSTYPSYFRSLTQEQVQTGNVGDAYARLRTQILAVAEARAIEGRIGKLAEKQLDVQTALGYQSKMIPRIKQQIIDLINAQSTLYKLPNAAQITTEEFEKAVKKYRDTHFRIAPLTGITVQDEVLDLVDKLGTYRDRAKASEQASKELSGAMKALTESTKLANTSLSVDPLKSVEKGTKDIKDQSVSLDELNKKYSILGASIGMTFGEANAAKANTIKGRLEQLAETGQQATSEFIKLAAAFNALEGTSVIDPLKSIKFGKDSFEKQFGLGDFKSVLKSSVADLDKILEGVPKAVLKHSKRAANGFEVMLNSVNKAANDILQGGLSDTISGLGAALGSLADPAASASDRIGMVLAPIADMLIQLGQLAISTGVAIAGIKLSLKSLNPVVAIAAGAALVALGTAVKGQVSNLGEKSSRGSGQNFGYRPFASGGIVSGPTHALVGEYAGARNNPEVIAPLDKLKGLLGNTVSGGVQVMIPEIRFSNEAMYVAFRRGEKSYKSKT